MGRGAEDVPRPWPKTPFRVNAKNRHVLDDWTTLLRTRFGPAQRCWDHIATTPSQPIGGVYTRLHGPQAWCEFAGKTIPQWQWEIDRRARVKIGVGDAFVVIVSVSPGHPKENE